MTVMDNTFRISRYWFRGLVGLMLSAVLGGCPGEDPKVPVPGAPPGSGPLEGKVAPLARQDKRDAVVLLGPGPHPPGEILGLPPEKALVATTPDMIYPEAKLTQMASTSRDINQKPADVLRLLGVAPGQVIADVGAGSGYFTAKFAQAVGPTGQVWATDILLDSLKFLQRSLPKDPANVWLVLHDDRDILLREGMLDLAFLCQVHFFRYNSDPAVARPLEEILPLYHSIHRALKPAGHLAIIERRGTPGELASISRDEIVTQMQQAGFELEVAHDLFELDHFLVFKKSTPP